MTALRHLTPKTIQQIKKQFGLDEFVGESPALRHFLERLSQLARSHAAVLLTGQSGTGKGLSAEAIHRLSPRADKPFEHVNCGSIPEQLPESWVFGHEKGAFR